MDTQMLLESPEHLDDYLSKIRERREANRRTRLRAYWSDSILRLRAEVDAANRDGDDEIAAELALAIDTFQRALDGSATITATASSPSISRDASCPDRVRESESSSLGEDDFDTPYVPGVGMDGAGRAQLGANGVHPLEDGVGARSNIAVEQATSDMAPAVVKMPDPVFDQAERDAYATRIAAHRSQTERHLEDVQPTLSFSMKSKALYCEGQTLNYHPLRSGEVYQSISKLLAVLAMESPVSNRDFPFCFTETNTKIWDDLANRYRSCIAASEALTWLSEHVEWIADSERARLLNSIAAAQQLLFRSIERLGGRDNLQSDFYGSIREHSKTAGWLTALSPSVSDQELIQLADCCEAVLEDVRADVQENQARERRAQRKEAAAAAVAEWKESLEGRAVTSKSLQEDRAQLCTLLDECLAAGVPPTNIKVREALIDNGSILLEGMPLYAKFLDAVVNERNRRSMGQANLAEPEDDDRDSDVDSMLATVIDFTRGKRIVMLGGKCRPKVAEELAVKLACDVEWPDSDEGDKIKKFETRLKRANIVLLLKNFAGHELFWKGREIVESNGGHFIPLPSGYGVNQVVYQISKFVARATAA